MNSLPALLIGGPPHAGKSVLFYAITHALRERGIPHHAIRACPDGEGNWSQEADQELVRVIRIKSEQWPEEFTQRICRDIEQRLLPMLIDMGGKPQGSQLQIFQHCTHSLLLLKPEDEQSMQLWQQLVEANGLLPIAQLNSSLTGPAHIAAESPVIKGTLSSLQRGLNVQGRIFDLLVERIAALFSSYTQQDLNNIWIARAPTELVVNVPVVLQRIVPGAIRWESEMIPALLRDLPAQTALSVYGQGPHWLYGTLAAYSGNSPFYQFDPRIGNTKETESSSGNTEGGWITPPCISFGSLPSSDVVVKLQHSDHVTVLTLNILKKHLDYWQAETLTFPEVTSDHGLILNGSMPSWLLTALVRLYAPYVAWIAAYYPPSHCAVVMTSQINTLGPGDTTPMTTV